MVQVRPHSHPKALERIGLLQDKQVYVPRATHFDHMLQTDREKWFQATGMQSLTTDI
jgi:hypothetical protein